MHCGCAQEEKLGPHLIRGDITLQFDGMNTRTVDYGQSFRVDHDELVKKSWNVILNPPESSEFGLPPCSMTTGKVSDSGIYNPHWEIRVRHHH